jgi:hypothetical protein
MNPFTYSRASDENEAVAEISAKPQGKFLGGGTNLIDLMKMGVETPAKLIDINRLPLAQIEELPDGKGLRIGALASKAIGSEDLRPRERQHTLLLFNMMLRLLKKPQLVETEQPYRSANLVRHLRNALIHPKPGWVVTFSENPKENLSEQQKIVKRLRRDLGLDRDATFPRDILNSKCADWAVRACESFLREFVKRSEVSPGFVTKDVF